MLYVYWASSICLFGLATAPNMVDFIPSENPVQA
jgi:hypothetical protein